MAAAAHGTRSTNRPSSAPPTDQASAPGRLWVQGISSSTRWLPGREGSRCSFSTPAMTRLLHPQSTSWLATM